VGPTASALLSTRAALAARVLLVSATAALAACGSTRPVPPPPPVAPLPLPPSLVSVRTIEPRVGIALGGGGARGFAQIGVLRVLEQEKIRIDFIAGTSVGSLVGALYADSGRVLDAEMLALEVRREDLFDFSPLGVFGAGLAKGEKLAKFVETHLKHRLIENMAIPFAAVAVDLRTGKAVAFEKGEVARAVRASAAIPAVFEPVEFSGTRWVDGGVVDPVPVDIARKMGADVVIAVSIPPAVPATSPDNPIQVALHAITIMSAEIGRLRAREADVVVAPDVGDVRYDDFDQKKRLIDAGETATRKAMPAIRAAIAAKTRTVTTQR
jgi:NTE family protein